MQGAALQLLQQSYTSRDQVRFGLHSPAFCMRIACENCTLHTPTCVCMKSAEIIDMLARSCNTLWRVRKGVGDPVLR